MYRQFVLPYERRVTNAIKATGVPVYTILVAASAIGWS
jgi:hypothetical protein